MPATHPVSRHAVAIRLPTREPFRFAASLGFITSFPAMTGQQGTAGDTLTLAVRERDTTLGVRLRAAEEGSALEGTLVGEAPISDDVLAAAADRLNFYLGLSDDLSAFYGAAAGDPPFARVLERLHGYHQVKFPSPLELMCWAILCQRVPMPVARSMKQALVTAVGNRIEVDGTQLWAFPDVAQLSALDETELIELIGNRRKAGYLHGAVQRWERLDEDFLRHGPYDAVHEALLSLPGIGPWSASFVMVRGLGRTERVGFDREMARAAQRVYGQALDEAAFRRLADHYGTAQGYWGHYLRVGG